VGFQASDELIILVPSHRDLDHWQSAKTTEIQQELATGSHSLNLELERCSGAVCFELLNTRDLSIVQNLSTRSDWLRRQKQILPAMSQQLQQLSAESKKMDAQIEAKSDDARCYMIYYMVYIEHSQQMSTICQHTIVYYVYHIVHDIVYCCYLLLLASQLCRALS
jgi:hypothetical protein